jgi:hypothetical protein
MLRHVGIWVLVLLNTLSAVVGFAQSPALGDKAEALWEAARKGDAAAVKKLLDEGLDVNTKLRYGATVLFYACDRGHVDIVKLLLERGADVNVKDTFYGATPLTWAVSPVTGDRKPQHAEIVGLLLARGAQGKGPALAAAVGGSDLVMTKVILDSGGLPADALSDALESAKTRGNQDLVAALQKAGAQPRVEFKLDEAQSARYAGTYRSPNGAEMVIAASGGRLKANAAGQQFTLVGRDETTFGVVEAPGVGVTFRFEPGKPTSLSIGQGANVTTFTREEGK